MHSVLFAVAALFSSPTLSLPACLATSPKGTMCALAAEAVHPTQLAYGELEVQRRTEKIAAMSAAELETYLKKHIVPVVVGPGGIFYATDGHHTTMALARAHGPRAPVIATIQDDWRTLAANVFWKRMLVAGRYFPFDETGAGPLPLARLPATMAGLRDDPYRSLANGVQNAGGYSDLSGTSYADFMWADFFRGKIAKDLIVRDLDAAVAQAKPLACGVAASQLPGYLPCRH